MSMKRTGPAIHFWLATLALSVTIWAAPAGAQTQTSNPQNPDVDRNGQNGQDSDMQHRLNPADRDDVNRDRDRDDHRPDIDRSELATMDKFLDGHPEIAEQLRKNPNLVNDQKWVAAHPALQEFMEDHPVVRQQFDQHPYAFMRDENRYERNDNDLTRSEVATMDRFLDGHPQIAQELQKNPRLIDDQKWVAAHPALQEFMEDHPLVRQQFDENPNAFMRAENRYERNDNDITRSEVANMDRFLDGHPEIAEQLRKNPNLVNNDKWVAEHPALKDYMQDHPLVREQFDQHPYAFMRDENKFDQHEDNTLARNGDVANFHEFLQGHSSIAAELSKNPSLANNQEYLQSHSELRDYLKANPQVNAQLSQNAETFVQSAQTPQAQSGQTPPAQKATPKAQTVPKTPTTDPKLK